MKHEIVSRRDLPSVRVSSIRDVINAADHFGVPGGLLRLPPAVTFDAFGVGAICCGLLEDYGGIQDSLSISVKGVGQRA